MSLKKTISFISNYFAGFSPEKEEYYMDRLLLPNADLMSHLFEPNVKTVYTTTQIDYEKNIFGCSEISLIKNLGSPDYILNLDNEKHNYSVLFHKNKFEKHRILRQEHFVDNVFFYACDTYKPLGNTNEQEIICSVLQEYSRKNDYAENNSITLCDILNNKIVIKKDVYLRVHYLKGMYPFKNIPSELLKNKH